MIHEQVSTLYYNNTIGCRQVNDERTDGSLHFLRDIQKEIATLSINK